MRRAILSGLATSLACATPAMGQIAPSGSGFSDAPKIGDSTEYWLVMSEMGACVAGSKSVRSNANGAGVRRACAFAGLGFPRSFHQERTGVFYKPASKPRTREKSA